MMAAPTPSHHSVMIVILCVIFGTILVLAGPPYIKPEDVDVQAYCGIEPYPKTIKPIPYLGREARLLKLKQLDQHIYFRHGDRSTIAAKCFNNVATHAEREWTECPHPIYNSHAGLTNRANKDGTIGRDNYRVNVQPFPNKNILNGNCHFGQLSQKGVMMSVNNGARYGRYLNQTQEKPVLQSSFRTRSTDVHRTRETGQAFMTGIYDQLPTMFPVPNTFSPQARVPPFFFVDNKVDALAMNDNMCDTKKHLDEAYADPAWIKYKTDVVDPLQEELAQILNQPNADTYDVFDCSKTLYCHGNALPTGIDDQKQKEMEAVLMNTYIQSFRFNHAQANILYTGVWAQETIALLSNVLDSKYNDNVYYINSGHDSNVQAMMQFLSFGKQQWPAYSALLQFEIYRTTAVTTDQTIYIRFLYDAEVVIPEFCTDQVVAGELCDLKKFITFLSTALPRNGECAGIPRQSVSSFKETMFAKEFGLETEAMENIKGFVGNMEQLYNNQSQYQIDTDIEPSQQDVLGGEPSHQEIWAKWAGL